MICNGVIGLAAAFGGILVDRKGPKLVATIGGISFGIGTIIGGIGVQMENILILYLGYGLLGGLGRGIGYVTPIATLIRWFPDKRGLVTGLAVMGVGAGAFLMGLIAPANIAVWGVANTLYLWGLIFWVLIVGSAQFFKNPPPGWQPAGFNPKAELRTSEAESCSFGEAIKSSQWWMLWSMLFLNVTAGIGLISQLSPLARELCPALRATALSSEQLALAVDFYGGLVVAVASIFNALGRLFWAWLSDGIGRKAVFSLLFLTQAVLYLIIPEIDSYYWFVVVSSYLLASYGGGFAAMPAFAADAFGSKNIGRIYGTMLTAWGAAGVVGPFIFSWVKQKTGSCNQALYLAAGLLGLGFILARKYQRPLCHKNC